MSSFQVLTLAYAFFTVGLFLFFWLLWKAKEALTEIAWDAIPHARISLRGHPARMMRLYNLYVPCVMGYIAVAIGAGFAELRVAELAQDASTATLANFFAFIMFLAGGGSIVLGIPAVISLAKTIRDDDRNAQATPSA